MPWLYSGIAEVAQHFLMSPAAWTLSLVDLCDLSEDAAHQMFRRMRCWTPKALRWAVTVGLGCRKHVWRAGGNI